MEIFFFARILSIFFLLLDLSSVGFCLLLWDFVFFRRVLSSSVEFCLLLWNLISYANNNDNDDAGGNFNATNLTYIVLNVSTNSCPTMILIRTIQRLSHRSESQT